MAKKKHKKSAHKAADAQKRVAKAGDKECGCNWAMAVDCVDDLMEWVNELIDENNKLKSTLAKTIDRLEADNDRLKQFIDQLPKNQSL